MVKWTMKTIATARRTIPLTTNSAYPNGRRLAARASEGGSSSMTDTEEVIVRGVM